MSFCKKLFGAKPDGPFMKHPSGDFDSAVAAMEDAVLVFVSFRVASSGLPSGQGEGGGPESYEFAEIRMLRDKLDIRRQPISCRRPYDQA